jgi:hypothetical protein
MPVIQEKYGWYPKGPILLTGKAASTHSRAKSIQRSCIALMLLLLGLPSQKSVLLLALKVTLKQPEIHGQ